jgi:branched-chain amino acid transport system permease protein
MMVSYINISTSIFFLTTSGAPLYKLPHMDSMALYIQYVISGITSGSVYAIIGISWSIVFLVTGILNFATGQFAMLGGMLTFVFLELGIPLFPSMACAIIGTVVLGMLLERAALRPVRFPSDTAYMVITIAASSIISGMMLLGVDSEKHEIPPIMQLSNINIGGATLEGSRIIAFVTLIVVAIGLSLFFNRTLIGKALRATAVSREGAALVGIRTTVFSAFSFALTGGLGALAGIVIAPITFTDYNTGMTLGVKGLVAALVGGWGIAGTVVAGLALGLLEGLFGGFVSTGWKDAIALLAMLLYLIIRTFMPSRGVKKG